MSEPNLDIDLPGHRRLCGCNDCYHYRRGVITPGAQETLDRSQSQQRGQLTMCLSKDSFRSPTDFNTEIVVLNGDSKIAHSVFFSMYDPIENSEYGQIDIIYIKPEYRGLGIGYSLIYNSIELMRQRGVKEIRAFDTPPESLAFYEHYGFKRYINLSDPLRVCFKLSLEPMPTLNLQCEPKKCKKVTGSWYD